MDDVIVIDKVEYLLIRLTLLKERSGQTREAQLEESAYDWIKTRSDTKAGMERPSRRREVGNERYVDRHVDHDLFVDNVEFRINISSHDHFQQPCNSLELEASLDGHMFPVGIY